MNELYSGLADIFEVDSSSIKPETRLEELGWDSLAMVSTLALFDEIYGKPVGVDKLKACQTIADIEALAAG